VLRAIPDDFLDFKPHDKTNTIRTILVHQLLSERRFGSVPLVAPEGDLPGHFFLDCAPHPLRFRVPLDMIAPLEVSCHRSDFLKMSACEEKQSECQA
jgi:hypothetical protein